MNKGTLKAYHIKSLEVARIISSLSTSRILGLLLLGIYYFMDRYNPIKEHFIIKGRLIGG